MDERARAATFFDVARIVLAGAARNFREATGAQEGIFARGVASGKSNVAIDSGGDGARASRGGMDGEADDRAVQDGVEMAQQVVTRIFPASAGAASGLR